MGKKLGHTIGKGHLSHGNGHGKGHEKHQHSELSPDPAEPQLPPAEPVPTPIPAPVENEYMRGSDGVDVMGGGDGDDVFGWSGAGVDYLWGNGGNDRFVFTPGDSRRGEADVIQDWSNDVIDLTAFDYTYADLTFTQGTGGLTVSTADGGFEVFIPGTHMVTQGNFLL